MTLIAITTGAIKSQISEIQYDDWPHECSFKTDSGKFIINNRKDFKQITDCIILNYDFNNYTIIGVQGVSGGCKRPTIDFKITKDDYTRKYIIEATILSYGSCRMGWTYKKIIYTDKLKYGYDIVFIKKNKAYSND